MTTVREGQTATLQELIGRATQGRALNRQTIFRPSLVYQVLYDPFWIWCEFHAPREEKVDETTRYDEMRMQRGIEYEQAWVQQHYPEAVKIYPEFGPEALKNTCKAMLEGAAAIYQPQLWDLGWGVYGKGDILIRDNSHGSDLGPYHYRVVEVKRSGSVKDQHILQAAFYNRILGRIQGYAPQSLIIALKDSTEQVTYTGREIELDEILVTWKALRDGQYIPEPGRPPGVTDSPWRVYGNKLVEGKKDLILLAGVGAQERGRLRAAGINSVDQLWGLRLEEVCRILGVASGTGAYYVAQAYKTGQPILRPGARLIIPRTQRHLYFDFETSDEVHPTQPPHVYLIGCWDLEQNRFVHFLARGAGDEERIFRAFIEYAGDLESVRLYHWTSFEIDQMKKVIQRWPALKTPLFKLFSSCVDLKEVIKSAVYLPVPTFSIKCVAPALDFKWRQADIGAFEAMVCYWDYLDRGDEAAIQKAIRYNEDDCLAMLHIDRQLTRQLG